MKRLIVPGLAVIMAFAALFYMEARLGAQAPVASSIRYLGQTPPGAIPLKFAPGIVSTDAIEINGVFRPDFREFFFARQVDKAFTLFRSTLTGGKWSAPEPLRLYPPGGGGMAVDMAYSPDGTELYFLGRFKPGVELAQMPFDIWMSRFRDGRWNTAEALPSPVNTEGNDSYPSLVADGSVYFSSGRPGGHGAADIYRSQRRRDGGFDTPVNLGAAINSAASEGDTFASPDERYLIVTTVRQGGLGKADLYVSFKSADGKWGELINLGPAINTADVEFCPFVTPDGRYLFFSRRYDTGGWDNTTDADVFWVDMSVVERLRK